MAVLHNLNRHQVEEALRAVYAALMSEEEQPTLEVPEGLQHLQGEDWEALVAALHVLLHQREHSPLH